MDAGRARLFPVRLRRITGARLFDPTERPARVYTLSIYHHLFAYLEQRQLAMHAARTLKQIHLIPGALGLRLTAPILQTRALHIICAQAGPVQKSLVRCTRPAFAYHAKRKSIYCKPRYVSPRSVSQVQLSCKLRMGNFYHPTLYRNGSCRSRGAAMPGTRHAEAGRG